MLDGQNGDEDTRQKKRMMQTYMTLFNVTNSSQQLWAFLLESVVQIMMMTLMSGRLWNFKEGGS